MADVPMAITTVGATLTVLALIYGGWRRLRPTVRRGTAALDALVGKEAVTDRSGQVLEPAKPGLVHRTTTLEQAVATLVDQDARIRHLENDHGTRIKALEDIRLDKLIGQVESAHMWRAVADNAISDPDEL